MKRLVVFISGNGSNLQALIDAELTAKIVAVVSNRRAAYGLQRAKKANIPTCYFPLKPYCKAGFTRVDYDVDLLAQIADYKPDFLVLAGWMHVFSPAFLDRYPNRVLNLHPALPGQFVGTHAIERAYQAFQQGEIEYTGVMTHWVVPEVDAGPVIATEQVPIYTTDEVVDLVERIHMVEHRILIKTINQL